LFPELKIIKALVVNIVIRHAEKFFEHIQVLWCARKSSQWKEE
jgi:hypothetical protein